MTPSAPRSSAKKLRAAANGAKPAAKGTASATPNGKRSGAKGGKQPSASLTDAELLGLYRSMYLIRRFEEKVIELFREGVLPGFLHVAIGQEAIASGVSQALDEDDYIGSTHRAHGHILARGSDPGRMMAELMGRVTGFCRGKGGSMHVADMSRNVVGANGVVGAGAPMMTGVALAQQAQGTGKLAVTFYGDGASNQGNVFEAMNLAQLWKLPALFICENNGYAESTPYWQQVPVKDLASRGKAFDMKTLSVDGNDVLAVYDTIAEACDFARSGKGPVYIVCHTHRIEGHYIGDAEVYRPKGEAKAARAHDPIPRFAKVLLGRKFKQADLDKVIAEVDELCDRIVEEARVADFPAPEEAMLHVYAEDDYAGPEIGI